MLAGLPLPGQRYGVVLGFGFDSIQGFVSAEVTVKRLCRGDTGSQGEAECDAMTFHAISVEFFQEMRIVLLFASKTISLSCR